MSNPINSLDGSGNNSRLIEQSLIYQQSPLHNPKIQPGLYNKKANKDVNYYNKYRKNRRNGNGMFLTSRYIHLNFTWLYTLRLPKFS